MDNHIKPGFYEGIPTLECDTGSTQCGNSNKETTSRSPGDQTPQTRQLRDVAITESTEGALHHNGTFESLSEVSDVEVNTYLPGWNHCHVPRNVGNNKARNQLIAVSILCLVFMAGEIAGGLIANSIAVITDGVHLASDLFGFTVSLFAIWIAKKRPTDRLSFGYYRAEIIGALVSVLAIWVATGVLFYLAVRRIIHTDYEIDADIMLITSGVGVAFNIIMGLVLHGGCFKCVHGHSHGLGGGHSHGHSHMVEERDDDEAPLHKDDDHKRNINVRAAAIHVLGDLVQSIGVFIGAVVIKFKPEYKIADPICTFVFSVLVIFTTLTILKDVILVIMEAVPLDINIVEVKSELCAIPGVRAAHSLHIWALTMDKNALSVHLAVADGAVNYNTVLQKATKLLRDKYSITESTIQVETFQESFVQSCEECVGPSSLEQSADVSV